MSFLHPEKPLFTLAVSCCNVAPYVAKTIQSIKEQTFSDFEAILVIEESKDDTPEVCKNEIQDDARFQIVNLPRSGSCSVSRNYCMENSHGKFILFLDGDDWIDTDSLEKFKKLIDSNPDVEIISSGAKDYMDYGDGRVEATGRTVFQGTPEAIFSTGCDFLLSIDFVHYWNPHAGIFLYRSALLKENKDLRQAPGRFHQDDEWTYRVLLRAQKTIVASFQHYNFRINANSVTNKKSSKTIYDRADNAISCIEFFQHGDYPEKFAKNMSRYYCLNFFWGLLLRKYSSHLLKNLLPREDCYKAVRRCLGAKAQWETYCRIAQTAGGPFVLGIPMMWLAKHKMTFPIAEYTYRIWTNRIKPILQKINHK